MACRTDAIRRAAPQMDRSVAAADLRPTSISAAARCGLEVVEVEQTFGGQDGGLHLDA